MDALTQKTQTALHLATAAIAGPALIWSALTYTGSARVRYFLGITGVMVCVTHFAYVDDALKSRKTVE